MSPADYASDAFDRIIQDRMRDIVQKHDINKDPMQMELPLGADDRRSTGGGRRSGEFNLGAMSTDIEFNTIFMYNFRKDFVDHVAREEANQKTQQEINRMQAEALEKLSDSIEGLNRKTAIIDEFTNTLKGLKIIRNIVIGFISSSASVIAAIWAIVQYGDNIRKFLGF